MIVRTVDKEWDFKFGHGIADYASQSLGIAYDLKMKILSWYRDCFFSQNSGIDYKNLIGSKNAKDLIDSEVKRIISEEEGVDEVLSFESSVEDRDYKLTARLKTVYNETIEVKV